MVFLEENSALGVFPTQQVDRRLTWGVARAWQQPEGLLEWGACRWNQNLETNPHIRAESAVCLPPHPFPERRGLHIGTRPCGRGSAASQVLHSGLLSPAKWRQGGQGVWPASLPLLLVHMQHLPAPLSSLQLLLS